MPLCSHKLFHPSFASRLLLEVLNSAIEIVLVNLFFFLGITETSALVTYV
jgi:hypothetical protein